MARTYDKPRVVEGRLVTPRVGSLWAHKQQPRIVVVVMAIRGPQWQQSVLWRFRGREGITSIQAFNQRFVAVAR